MQLWVTKLDSGEIFFFFFFTLEYLHQKCFYLTGFSDLEQA